MKPKVEKAELTRHRMWVLALTTICAVSFSVGQSAVPVSAWTSWGCKWNHANVKYWAPSPYLSYPTWTSAANSWAGLDASYTVVTSTYDVYALNENRGNTVTWTGVTRKKGTIQSLPTCTGGYMTTGQVETVLNWSLMDSLGYSAAKRQGAAAHEIGHALGLHHVPISNVLMYGAGTRTVTTPPIR
jgi:hypothetical protein